jgi:hypothetical protein
VPPDLDLTELPKVAIEAEGACLLPQGGKGEVRNPGCIPPDNRCSMSNWLDKLTRRPMTLVARSGDGNVRPPLGTGCRAAVEGWLRGRVDAFKTSWAMGHQIKIWSPFVMDVAPGTSWQTQGPVRQLELHQDRIPRRLENEHQRFLARLSPADRVKLARATERARTAIVALRERQGLSPRLDREVFLAVPWAFSSGRGDNIAGQHFSNRQGWSFATVDPRNLSSLSEDDLTVVIAHEWIHADLGFSLFRDSARSRTARDGLQRDATSPPELEGRPEALQRREALLDRLYGLNEFATHFLAITASGVPWRNLAKSISTGYLHHGLLSAAMSLPPPERAALEEAFLASISTGSVRPLYAFHARRYPDAVTTHAGRAALMQRILAGDESLYA